MRKASGVAVGLLLAMKAAAVAGPEHLQVIGEQCGIQLGLPASVCGCIADSAADQLSDAQQAFMVAQITKDQAEINRLQSTITVGDMTTVGSFMTWIVGQCQG